MHALELCIYCQTEPATTRDHAPPKCLFGRPLPENLITVPCCSRCNASFAKDDEYFRAVLLIREGVYSHPEAQKSRGALLRSLAHPEGAGFSRMMFRSFEKETPNFMSRMEDPHGPPIRYAVDRHRVTRVLRRIVRALFWRHTTVALPVSSDIMVKPHDLAEYSLNNEYGPEVTMMLVGGKADMIGDYVFWYQFARHEGTNFSVTLLQFFQWVTFVACTFEPGD
jgi:hypothetical protein